MIDWSLFHFIRPYWFLAFIPLFIGFVLLLRAAKHSTPWMKICDEHLLNHLLVKTKSKNSLFGYCLYFIIGTMLIFAIAGPTWEQSKQPVFQSAAARVFILDLSLSMKAEDIKPTRLARAKLKLLDMLELTTEGQSALIVFASSPFVVSPLTDDADTIAAMIPTLDSDLMPAQGSRPELALKMAGDLLSQSNTPVGDIFLITDGVNDLVLAAADSLVAQGHRLSVLAVGTENGAPIPYVGGGFVNDASGGIVIPKTDFQLLSTLANRGNGFFSSITANDNDVNYLLSNTKTNDVQEESEGDDRNISLWQEKGSWLLLIALPFFALAFRRGWLVVVSFVVVLPVSDPVYALEWKDLWSTKNQQAESLYQAGNRLDAANTFVDPSWKAAAFYKAEDYARALELYSSIETLDGHYNKGNTLAKLGKIQEAISEYQKVLEKNPEHEDARFNLDLLQRLQEEQNQGQDSGQEGKKSEKSDAEESQSGGEQQQESDQSSEQGEETEGQNANTAQEPDNFTATQDKEQNQGEDENTTEQASSTEPDESEASQEQQKTSKMAEQKQQISSQQYAEQQQALEQWLRRIPDDPGGLLREKFQRQFQRRQRDGNAVVNEW